MYSRFVYMPMCHENNVLLLQEVNVIIGMGIHALKNTGNCLNV